MNAIRTVAILGAGAGGCAVAADLTQRGCTVRMFSRRESSIAPIAMRGGVEYEGALGEGFAAVTIASTDIGRVMQGAELVMLVVPTHAHETMAALLAPHLAPEQILFLAPGHTLTLVPNVLRQSGIEAPRHCESGTLPYICRKSSAIRVRITKASEHIVFGVFPSAETEAIAARIHPLFPAIKPAANILETVFPYTNAIHHPPAALCNVGRIEATQGDYTHYYEGISPSVGRLIDALDRERLAIAAALGARAERFVDYFFRAGYTTEAARASGLAYEAFHQSEPDRWIRAPASLDHRFFHEDVPYGLVLLTELGRAAGVPTPTALHIVHLAGIATGHDYRAEGLTLERLGLTGVGRDALIKLLDFGFKE
ncbi:MAG: NAD/NADP octopine/nopaline dehydrogenase family protein [Burkholderiales bacterium]